MLLVVPPAVGGAIALETQTGLSMQVPRPETRFGPDGYSIPPGTWRAGPSVGVRLSQRTTFQQADLFAHCTFVAGRPEFYRCRNYGAMAGAGRRLELRRLTLEGGLSLGVERVFWPDTGGGEFFLYPRVTWELLASPSFAVSWQLSANRPYTAAVHGLGLRVAADCAQTTLGLPLYYQPFPEDRYRALRIELFLRTQQRR